MHGYYNPTLVDGLTKPHNPGLEYDKFLYWNQRRLDANQVGDRGDRPRDPAAGQPVGRSAGGAARKNGNPAVAEGWDDWGPFYSQTYGAFFGVDGSTVEMCNDAACGGRLGSKREQYVVFYSSADFWIENRDAILRRPAGDLPARRDGRGPAELLRRPARRRPGLHRGPAQLDGRVPQGVPDPSRAARSGATREANRLVQWLLDNGVEVERTEADLIWRGTTYPAGSYVVSMQQAFRGFAYTALAAGQDISDRISQLYAPPGAWSHGLLWGADVVEVPAGDASFAPSTVPVAAGQRPPGRRAPGPGRLVRR